MFIALSIILTVATLLLLAMWYPVISKRFLKEWRTKETLDSFDLAIEHQEWLEEKALDGMNNSNLSELSSISGSLANEKLRLLQRLNYHRVVKELDRHIRMVVIFTVTLFLSTIAVLYYFYKGETLEPTTAAEYVQFAKSIDTVTRRIPALPISDEPEQAPRLDDHLTATRPSGDTIFTQFLEYRSMKELDALTLFTTNYTRFVFWKQILVRSLVMLFLFSMLAYLLRMYRRLIDKRTRFRQLEEATTVTLFYLFKQADFVKKDEKGTKEAEMIEKYTETLIHKLFDFQIVETIKSDKETFGHVKETVDGVTATAKDLASTVKGK